MTTSLDALKRVMPPPTELAVDLDWSQAEAELGVQFGSAVREIFDSYGPGVIGGELRLDDPRTDRFARGLNLIGEVIEASRADDLLAEERPEHMPPFPPLGHGDPALLPAAGNGNADYIFLVMSGGVVLESPLYVANLRNDWWIRYPGSLTDLVLETITGGAPAVVELLGDFAWNLRPEFAPFSWSDSGADSE